MFVPKQEMLGFDFMLVGPSNWRFYQISSLNFEVIVHHEIGMNESSLYPWSKMKCFWPWFNSLDHPLLEKKVEHHNNEGCQSRDGQLSTQHQQCMAREDKIQARASELISCPCKPQKGEQDGPFHHNPSLLHNLNCSICCCCIAS